MFYVKHLERGAMKKIFIGVGHGGNDSGAVYKGIKEKDLNLVISNSMKDYLLKHRVDVRMSRYSDENDPLSERIRECNEFKPDCAIDVHNNAGGGDGFEGWIYPNSQGGLSLGKAIEHQVTTLGQNSRGIKSSTKFGFTRETKCISIILEGAFMDSSDFDFIDTIEEQKRLGIAYAKGVLAYLGISEIPETKQLYCVQVGAYSDKANAEKKAKECQELGLDTFIWVK